MLQLAIKYTKYGRNLMAVLITATVIGTPSVALAGTTCGGGSGQSPVKTTIDLGCRGQGNPIEDMIFAFIRFLSMGVGLVLVGSFIVGGIQYSASRGDPQATAKAVGRIQATFIALLIYIFGYAFLNYIIPGMVLR